MEPDPKAGIQPGRSQSDVVCAKCHHLNPAAQRTCEQCGSRLYITCRNCGRRNQRVASRCAECGERLHRTAWRRWLSALGARRGKVTLLQVVTAILAAYVVYRIIVMLAEYSPPPPE
ncbi:MAG: zinc ribbon domain-containing protein [Verrucomicrobia bacterium]|nr:zinc ribbon domain-containing protein [Verrucomicrobiota bacterium]